MLFHTYETYVCILHTASNFNTFQTAEGDYESDTFDVYRSILIVFFEVFFKIEANNLLQKQEE